MGLWVTMQLASERVQRTGSGGVSQQQGGGFSEWNRYLCQKSEATEEPGARPRPVSIACRYVRTHAMSADKAVRAVQVQSSVFGLCRRHSGPQTSQAALVSYDDDTTLFHSFV